MTRWCLDKECAQFGIPLDEEDFPINQHYDNGLHPYCLNCCARRREEGRRNEIEQAVDHSLATYIARHEAKRQAEMQLAMQLRMQERLTEPFRELPLPVLPWFTNRKLEPRWRCW